jgi:hypothetical protein
VIYPDFTAEEWCKKHPALTEHLPGVCSCGAIVTELRPYYAQHTLGLVSGECECGESEMFTVGLPRSSSLRSALVSALLTL